LDVLLIAKIKAFISL